MDELDEEIDLKSKILEGYYYKIDSGRLSEDVTSKEGYRNVNLHCGYGGVGLYIDTCRQQGLPDSLTAQSIFVFLEKDYYPISKLNLTKNAKS